MILRQEECHKPSIRRKDEEYVNNQHTKYELNIYEEKQEHREKDKNQRI